MDQDTLPNLFVPGAQKSGTSTLYDYLASHPAIYMSPNKEPNYLTRTDKSVADYELMFGEARGVRYRGEASTGYMTSRQAVAMMERLIPDPRFVFVLRNPIDRAWSHYWWISGRYGREPRPFREAFLHDASAPAPDPMPENRGYFHGGHYDRWIRMYARVFGMDRVFVTTFDRLIAEPLATVNQVCDFLDLDPLPRLEPRQANRTEMARFPAVMRYYSHAARGGGKLVRHVLPQRTQVRLIRLNYAGQRRLGQLLAAGSPPRIDQESREWIKNFYSHSVIALRDFTGLRIAEWDQDFCDDGGWRSDSCPQPTRRAQRSSTSTTALP